MLCTVICLGHFGIGKIVMHLLVLGKGETIVVP